MANPFDEEEFMSPSNDKEPTDISYSEIATKLIRDNLLLTALELHTELVEAGREVHKLKEFFSNPGNFESQASLKPELTSLVRSSSQATLDSLDLTRYSEDGERGVDERVAVLEFELRKAKETISALRANLTVATESETTTPDAGCTKLPSSDPIKPHEQRALNFLVNEYLLLYSYKLTSITFADENENQDFEDWDDVGLNISKPPELLALYREYMHQSARSNVSQVDVETQTDDFYSLDPADVNKVPALEAEINQLKDHITSLENDKAELHQRLWSVENRSGGFDEQNALSCSGTQVENSSTHSITPERFELIEADKTAEDQDISRTEDDGSVVSLAGTDTGWTRVVLSESTTNENLSELASPHVQQATPDILNSSELLGGVTSRSLPPAFQKEVLSHCFVKPYKSHDGNLEVMLNNGMSEKQLVHIVSQTLPKVVPNVILTKREELLPLIVCAIHLHPEISERDRLLHLLFNLKKRPQEEERCMILAGIMSIARHSGISLVENEILPQCWEQITHRHVERRLLVAESCSALAPYVSSSIRNSLMLSMLQQMLLEDKEEAVREVVVRSLSLIVTFMDDNDKYHQCQELMLTALDDPSPAVVSSVIRILLPVVAKWASDISRLQNSLLTLLLQRLMKQLNPSNAADPATIMTRKNGSDQKVCWTLMALQMLLPYVVMNVVSVAPVLGRISSDTPHVDCSKVFDLSNSLSNPSIFYEGEQPVECVLGAFEDYLDEDEEADSEDWSELNWITTYLVPELLNAVQCVEVTHELIVKMFVKLFRGICTGFGKSFVKKKLKPLFSKQLSELEKLLTNSKSSSWPSFTIIPVYFLGVLAITQEQDTIESLLKRFVCALPLCGAPVDALHITVKGLCEYSVFQELVLATLWEAVVHKTASVRCAAASLFTTIIGTVSDALVAARVAPALVTLSSDPDVSVRTSTIPAFGSLISNTTLKEIQDKTYMQLQSFLSDPVTRDNHGMMVQLVITMGNIVSSCEAWFREEFILPQLAAISAYTSQLSNQTRRLDLATSLIDAFSSAVYCTMSKQTMNTVLLPGLMYLEPVTSQSLHSYHDTLMAMIAAVESQLEIQRPLERSGSMSFSTATTNVGQGMEDVKQKVTKYFQTKQSMNKPVNLPSFPVLFKKK